MYKNLPIGKKIGFGFALIIGLVVILMGFAIVTSFMRSNDLSQVGNLAEMRRGANSVLANFNDARISANVVFDDLNSDEAHTAVGENVQSAQGELESLAKMSEENDQYQMEVINKLAEELPTWQHSVDEVHENNVLMESSRDSMISSSEILATASTELWQSIAELSIALAADGDIERLKTRVETVISQGVLLSEMVDAMRLSGANILLIFDKESFETVRGQIEEIKTSATKLRGQLTTQEAKQNVDQMLSDLGTYEESMNAFEQAMNTTDTAVQTATTEMEGILGDIDAFNAQITTDMQARIDSATTAATLSAIVMAALTLVGVGIAVALALFLARSITSPIVRMKDMLLKVGKEGDITLTPEIREGMAKDAAGKDEVAQSAEAARTLVLRLEDVSNVLEAIANGDLTQDLELLSDKDLMGKSLETMSEQLNDMFTEINSVSSQVATGSGEIATGAQSLAQGATEQASTVQQISASINEISNQADISVSTSQDAAQNGNKIREIALEGNQKMEKMMEAVQEINEASQSIEQVIKVIDDIAFQTNILALNAAVEAARAGEHGKGFAVVADEVRNLAAKSADAAKKTATLISANIEKTELGLSISKSTAESLSEIVEGIQNSSESLQNVAEQADTTRAATTQVNQAVEQVAQVVQQNSATSEQSAAASQEMSSQAQVLQQLISRFKLRTEEEEGAEMPLLPETGTPVAESGPGTAEQRTGDETVF